MSLRSPRDEKFLNLLAQLAITVEPVRKARMASCLVRRNEIVAFGVNKLKSHPFQAKFSKNEDSIYLHAEIDCIKNALRAISIDELRDCTLYIARMKYESTHRRHMIPGLARPCIGCQSAIQAFDIKKVIYTEG